MTREEAIEVYNGLINEKIKEAFEFFAPELAESKDERIRKGLIEALKTSKTVGELKFILPEPTREEAIAYLEKQKEQKHPNGCFTCDEYKKGYEAGRLNGFTAGYNKAMKEQKPVEWKPQSESLEALKYAIEGKWKMIKPTSYLSRRLEDLYEELVNNFNVDETLIADKDIEELKAMKAETDASMEESVEWSEEDEEKMNSISEIIEHCVIIPYSGGKLTVSKEYKKELQCFLKSLRPQSNWKPSEEQMKALKYAAYHMLPGEEYRDVLFSLFKDLKNLM